jgi:trehalose-phosphatase
MVKLPWPPEVAERVRAAGKISLFLDFDGTLAPIVATPKEAQLDRATRETLARISRKDHILTTVISGRELLDLRARVGLPDIVYAGNHGLEISGPGVDYVEPTAAAKREQMRQLAQRLTLDLRPFPGVSVEYKGLTTTVHYRGAVDLDVPRIGMAVRLAATPFGTLFRVNSGKKIFELTPRTVWHKGMAVRWINAHLGVTDALCIYFGDDRTDEDAFGALPEAITFKVGGTADHTHARYLVASPAEVHQFLQWLERHEPPQPPAK